MKNMDEKVSNQYINGVYGFEDLLRLYTNLEDLEEVLNYIVHHGEDLYSKNTLINYIVCLTYAIKEVLLYENQKEDFKKRFTAYLNIYNEMLKREEE